MITIMTPTYNRAYLLSNAYHSLTKQTSYAFEWIIIDDGSTDNTEELVARWISVETRFSILYQKQENGGKHRAVNKGVALANYDYFLILDSDDTLSENAVEKIHEWAADIAGLPGFAGVAGLKGIGDIPVGGMPAGKIIDATNLERTRYGLQGDKAEAYKTEVLRQYPFPEFEGENFLRESASWDRIARDGLKLRWYSEIIYFCDYIEDGLTRNTNADTYVRNFQGFLYCTRLFLQTHSIFPSLNKCGDFYHVTKLKGMNMADTAKLLDKSTVFLALGICYYRARQAVKGLLIQIIKGKQL